MFWWRLLSTSIPVLIILSCINCGQVNQQSPSSIDTGRDQEILRDFCKQRGKANCTVKDVTYCDLIRAPGSFHQQIVKVQAILRIQKIFRLATDPERHCGTFEPQVSVEIIGDSQFVRKDIAEREIFELLKSENVTGDYAYRVTIIGEFSANIPRNVIPNKISIITLENIEKTSVDSR
jgi:hypothetical protein